jgi:hypothetical protein
VIIVTPFRLPLTGAEPCAQVDPELFDIDEAPTLEMWKPYLRDLCSSCPVFTECRDHAIKHEEYGFWGGMSANERKMYRRRHGIMFESITRWNMRVTSERERNRKEVERDDLRRLPTRGDLQYAVAKEKRTRSGA